MSSTSWRELQKQNFRDIEKLSHFLELSPSLRAQLKENSRFSLNLPLRLAKKMAKNTLTDPLVRQFVPLKEENLSPPGFVLDPVADASFCKTEKLLQKYEGRALLLASSACAMHCRYCFRQNFDYTDTKGYTKELQELERSPDIKEVMLSGGDPLSLSDATLESLLTHLNAISSIEVIRFHTRFPIGIPERITPSFLRILKEVSKQIVFVVHINHPDELDQEIFTALKQIQCLGLPVLQQGVLLKGINDAFLTLKTLYSLLIKNGILPYSLNQLDRVEGTSHFEVEEGKGKALIQELTSSLPGYAIPRYVREIPGKMSKTSLL